MGLLFDVASDFLEKKLDLNALLVTHPAATYFVRMDNDLPEEGLGKGDLLIVDRAENVRVGSLVVALVEGEFVVRRVKKLAPMEIWGVISYVIHKCRPR